MSEAEVVKKKSGFFNRLKNFLIPYALRSKGYSQRIAYIAVMTAFVVVFNMFFEFKLMDTQFSLTICVSAVAGMVLGPLFGFAAAFLGDLAGFLYNSGGFAYMPWIGLSMGFTAAFSGMMIGGINGEVKWNLYLRIALVCLSVFLVCTVGINTTAFWILYSKVSYGKYLFARLFVQGQIWNSVFNSALLFIIVPTLKRIKYFGAGKVKVKTEAPEREKEEEIANKTEL